MHSELAGNCICICIVGCGRLRGFTECIYILWHVDKSCTDVPIDSSGEQGHIKCVIVSPSRRRNSDLPYKEEYRRENYRGATTHNKTKQYLSPIPHPYPEKSCKASFLPSHSSQHQPPCPTHLPHHLFQIPTPHIKPGSKNSLLFRNDNKSTNPYTHPTQ